MTRYDKTNKLRYAADGKGIDLSFEDMDTLRRAEMTLHGWYEKECGTGNGCIERDETTKKTYWLNSTSMKRYPIADRETGALRRISEVCKRNGLEYYIQGDCRGAALYIGREKLNNSNYTSAGFCVCGR